MTILHLTMRPVRRLGALAVLLAATGPALPGASALLIVLLRAWALSIPALLAAAVTAPAFGAMLRDASRSNRPAVDARAVASGD